MDGKFVERSLQFKDEGAAFIYRVSYENDMGKLNGASAYILITSETETMEFPCECALTVQVEPPNLTGKVGKRLKYYHPKALAILEALNNGLPLIPSSAEFESIDGLVRKAYEMGKY